MDGKTTFWWRWLMVAAMIVLAFGLALVLFANPVQRVFESMYFTPLTGLNLNAEAAAYASFLGAVMGAVMIGWAVLLLFVLYGPFRRMEPFAWDMITASLIAWFVADTVFSFWSGYWQNAILNTAMLMMFAIPLSATYSQFHRQRT